MVKKGNRLHFKPQLKKFKPKKVIIFMRIICCLLLSFCSHMVLSLPKTPVDATFAAAKNCVGCHQTAVSDWQQSDHAKAMAPANASTVLGDFNQATFSHFTQTARFYTDGSKYKIEFTEQEKTTIYDVAFTFGHYPLQEYLIKTDQGKMQVFPIAWDSRTEAEGGQRWYPIYPDEDIQAADRLHWQQPLQNWNGMCADCHSDGLKRNYSVQKKQFDTTWDNINVGCQSCHSDMAQHGELMVQTKSAGTQTATAAITLNTTEQQQALGWLLQPGEKVARWQGKKRDNQFMDTCFACHALRSPLNDGITPNVAFLDQFSPSLLTQPLYHSDGQIKDEVYVYGSFLQSKMYGEGVNCLDCHNKHTMKVKIEGNGLCLQCHNPVEYQTEQHTFHPLDSDGGQCVSCHMPQTTYMGVDARRDHSFKIPRPHLSDQYDTPNACINCHTDKTAQWAAQNVKNHFGRNTPISVSEQHFIDLMLNRSLPLEHHLSLINDATMSEIKRASALALLPNSTQYITDSLIKPWVNSDLPLIRLATALIGQLLPAEERLKTFKTLLSDRYKAVRVAAANHFVDVNVGELETVKLALSELSKANLVSSWRGEGNLNRAIIYQTSGKSDKAIEALSHGIEVDPYFEPNYINLADIYRSLGDVKNEKLIYERGLKANPKSGTLYYSYGMFQIRNGDKQSSVDSFKNAVKQEPDNGQFAYLYFLALDNIGKTKQAVSELKRVIKRYRYQRQLVELGLSFSQKLQDRDSYQFFIPHYQR